MTTMLDGLGIRQQVKVDRAYRRRTADEKESLDQGWANFLTGGPHWVLKLDRRGRSR